MSIQRLKKYNDRKNSYYGHWALPKDWSKDQMKEYNLSQYKKYLKQTKSIGDISATKTSFFLQPTPAMHKELSDYEKSTLKNQPIDYLDTYIKLEKTFLSLKDDGLDVYSLTKIYEDVKESVYSDGIHAIHTRTSDDTRGSLGYEIMAKEISDKLAISWGFTNKNTGGNCQQSF